MTTPPRPCRSGRTAAGQDRGRSGPRPVRTAAGQDRGRPGPRPARGRGRPLPAPHAGPDESRARSGPGSGLGGRGVQGGHQVLLRTAPTGTRRRRPRRGRCIWGEVRDEIATGIVQQGGVIDEVEGPLGWELRAQVPVQLPDGNRGVQLVRFVGVDGPRWFLRGVISGQGAVQPEAAGLLEQIVRDTVVVRGDGPMAPRDPIVLKLPNDAQMVPDGVQQEEQANSRFSGGMGQLQRGPEVSEIR
ncbi:DUF3710 domain-containing protein [Streptomyces narbonensis]